MRSIKVLFFLAVWQRPEITEICFKGLKRLSKVHGFKTETLAVISEDSMIPLCEKYDVKFCIHENLPVGRKKNFGLSEALKRDFDYLIELGSDDLLKSELLELYRPHFIERKPMLGIGDFVYLDSETGTCRFVKAKASVYGIGRAIKKDVLEKFPVLWPDKFNKGLDKASHFLLARNGVNRTNIKSDTPLAIDIKSETNIWPFNHFEGRIYAFDEAVKGLSKDEIESIKALQHVTA